MQFACKAFFSLSLIFTCLPLPTLAMEKDGITLSQEITIDGKPLLLNGMGTRTELFGIKVYVAGLYLPQKESDPSKIFLMPGPKHMILRFKMAVNKGQIQSALEDSFADNCEEKCDSIKPQINALKALLPELKKGDTLSYTLSGESVSIAYNDVSRGKVEGKLFSKTLLSTWIGKKPPSEKLKNGLLGINE